MNKTVLGIFLILCLLFFVTSIKDLAFIGIIASGLMLLMAFIENIISRFQSQISELSEKLNGVCIQLETAQSKAASFNVDINKFNHKADNKYIAEYCQRIETLDAILDKVGKAINDLSEKVDGFKNTIAAANESWSECAANSNEKIYGICNDIKEKIAETVEYEKWQIPDQIEPCFSWNYDNDEIKKIMVEIANLTLTGFTEKNELLLEFYLTYLCTGSLINEVPSLIEELKSDERRNFIKHFNSFRGMALRYGVLTAYDDVQSQINDEEGKKYNVIDMLLDHVVVLKNQNDRIISKINEESLKNDRNFVKKELIEWGLIEDPSPLCGDPEYSQYKIEMFKCALYRYFDDHFGQNYTIQKEVESCGFKLDLVITKISSKKTVAIEDRLYGFRKEEEQRRRILEAAGWQFYRIKYHDYQVVPKGKEIIDWFSEELERNNIAQDIIKLLD